MTTHIKSLLLGAAIAFAGVLAGEGLAHADCDYMPLTDQELVGYGEAMRAAKFCHTGTYWVEASEPGVYVAMCGDASGNSLGTVRDVAEERCGYAEQGWLEDEGMTEAQLGGPGGMWEACMRLASGGAYDTDSGDFWKAAR